MVSCAFLILLNIIMIAVDLMWTVCFAGGYMQYRYGQVVFTLSLVCTVECTQPLRMNVFAFKRKFSL